VAKIILLEYERFAQKSGWETNKECRVAFNDLPEANRKTMIWVAESILERIKKEIEDKLLIKCECENGECPNCQRLCEVIDNLL
jgi:hypothetical protein